MEQHVIREKGFKKWVKCDDWSLGPVGMSPLKTDKSEIYLLHDWKPPQNCKKVLCKRTNTTNIDSLNFDVFGIEIHWNQFPWALFQRTISWRMLNNCVTENCSTCTSTVLFALCIFPAPRVQLMGMSCGLFWPTVQSDNEKRKPSGLESTLETIFFKRDIPIFQPCLSECWL